MGTRGLEIVRFRGRYYIRYNQYDSYYEGLGAEIIAKIPADPEEYQSASCLTSANAPTSHPKNHMLTARRMAREDAGRVCGQAKGIRRSCL